MRPWEEREVPFRELLFVHQSHSIALVDVSDRFEKFPGEALREKLSRQIEFLGLVRVVLRGVWRTAVEDSFGNPLNRVYLLSYSVHLDDEVSNHVGEILLGGTREECLDVPPHLHDDFIRGIDGKGILTNDASEVGFVHEQKEIVEAVRLKVNMLEQLVGIDCRQDIRCIGVRRSRRFGGDEKQPSEVRVNDIRS